MLVAPSNPNVVPLFDASGAVAADTRPQASADQDGAPVTKADLPDDDKPRMPAHTGWHAILVGLKGDIEHLPSTTNLYIAGIGGALALGVPPADQTVNARLISHYDIVNNIFTPAKYYGDTPEQLAFSIGAWAIGRITHKPKMSHLGMDLLRAQALTEIWSNPSSSRPAESVQTSATANRFLPATQRSHDTISVMLCSGQRWDRSPDAR
jgi:hypothetical protein